MQGDRLVELAVAQHVEQRTERLGPDDLALFRHRHERRCQVVGIRRLVGELTVATGDERASLCRRRLDRRGDGGEGGAVDQRPDERAVAQRVADRHRGVGLGEALDELVVDGVVDDQTAQAGAPLPGSSDRREGDAAHGEVEVGAGGDDRRVVAAELEDHAPEPSGDDRRHGPAHPRRPGRRHDGDVGVSGEGGPDVGTALEHLVETPRCTDLGWRRVAAGRRTPGP